MYNYLFCSQERTNPISRGGCVVQSEIDWHIGSIGSTRGPDVPSSFGGSEDGDSSCWRTQTTNRRPGQHRWITLAGRKVWGNDLRKYNN